MAATEVVIQRGGVPGLPGLPGPVDTTSDQMQLLMSVMHNDRGDANIVCVTDSTGLYGSSPGPRWPYVMSVRVGVMFPRYTIKLRPYDATTNTYPIGSEQLIQTGTGTHTLTVFLAAVSGVSSNYYSGARFDVIATQINPLVALLGLGHNGGDDPDNQVSRMASLTSKFARRLPNTPIIIVGQNPTVDGSGNDAGVTGPKVAKFKMLAQQQGYGFYDGYSLFLDAGVPLSTLMSDLVHPNTAGYDLWGKGVATMFQYSYTKRAGAGLPSTQFRLLRFYSNFADFSTFNTGGSVAPTLTKTTTSGEWETYGHATKITCTGASGWIFIDLISSEDIPAFIGKSLSAWARIKVATGQPIDAGRIQLDDGVISPITSDGGCQGASFYWIPVSILVSDTATRVRLYIFGASTAVTTEVIVDRVVFGEGVMVSDQSPPNKSTFRGIRLWGSDTNGLLVAHNNTTGLRGITMLSTTAGANTDNPTTQYTFSMGGDQFVAKGRSDSFDRVKIDTAGGVWFGLGTATIAVRLSCQVASALELANAALYSNTSNTYDLGLSNKYWRRLYLGLELYVNGLVVIKDRRTGWTAATGTADRTTYATYTAPTISNPPTQAEVQAIADALQIQSRHQKALIDDCMYHGFIGA